MEVVGWQMLKTSELVRTLFAVLSLGKFERSIGMFLKRR